MIEKTCCFTGHRPTKLPWRNNESSEDCIVAKNELHKQIEYAINQGYKHFIAGMALGSDMYFAESVLSLKNVYPYIKLECAIPCPSQASCWNEDNRQRYQYIIDKSDKTTFVSNVYSANCMHKRNKYMVDNSSLLLCMLTSSDKRSGTKSTVAYAKKHNVEVINIFDYIVF